MPSVSKPSARAVVTRLTGALALVSALSVFAPPVANAAPTDLTTVDSTRSAVSVTTVAGTDRAGDASTLSSCAITAYGHTGYRICEFDMSVVDHGGGNLEYFVIGTNYAMYHIWRNSNGWRSLGGEADRQTPNGAYAYSTGGGGFGVSMFGTNDALYCRDWPWTSPWRRC